MQNPHHPGLLRLLPPGVPFHGCDLTQVSGFFSGAIAGSIHRIIELRRNNDMSEDSIGTRKGDYEILGVLGTGGMGKVYKVRNLLSDRIEAMKVLLPNLADQKDLGDRFLREIKVLAVLSHPNIAALRTALMMDNQLVMIMEYVEGTTLAARVAQAPIFWKDAANYVD